jgi:hypothetical protein
MRVRLALAILLIAATFLTLSLPAGTVVSPQAVSAAPGPWLDRFNAIRAAAGLSPVVEQASLSSDAAKHVNYMLLNPGEFEHSEIPGHSGYTPEGNRSASQSNLFRSSPGFTELDAINGWMESLFHRYGMLRPELVNTGFAGVTGQRLPSRWTRERHPAHDRPGTGLLQRRRHQARR